MSETGTSSNSSNLDDVKFGELLKKYSETIKLAAQQMDESNKSAKGFGSLLSELSENVAEAVELDEQGEFPLCALMGITREVATIVSICTEDRNKNKKDGNETAKGIHEISQLFAKAAEQAPDGPLKMISDMASASCFEVAESTKVTESKIAAMASAFLGIKRAANKYPKLADNCDQNTSNSNRNMAQNQVAMELLKAAQIAGGIGQFILQFCDGPVNNTVQNTANGTDALVQSLQWQNQGGTVEQMKMDHVNICVKERKTE